MLVAVTRPLEEAAYSVAGTTLVRSTTTRGSAEIDVNFAESTDPTTSFELLGAALAEARAHLPPGTTVDTRLLTTGTFPILDLSLSSRVRNLTELTDIAFYDLVPSLHRIARRLPGRDGRRQVPRVRGAAGSGADARARTHARPGGDRAQAGQRDRLGRPPARPASDAAHGRHRRTCIRAINCWRCRSPPSTTSRSTCATSPRSNPASWRITSAPPARTARRCWWEFRARPTATPSSSPSRPARSSPSSAAATRTSRSPFPTTRRRWWPSRSPACATRSCSGWCCRSRWFGCSR